MSADAELTHLFRALEAPAAAHALPTLAERAPVRGPVPLESLRSEELVQGLDRDFRRSIGYTVWEPEGSTGLE